MALFTNHVFCPAFGWLLRILATGYYRWWTNSRSCFSTSVPWLQTDSAVLAAAISDSERDRCESLQMFAAHVNWGSPWTINSKVCSDIIRKAFFLYFWYSEWFWTIFCYRWSWKTFCCTAVRRITETAVRRITETGRSPFHLQVSCSFRVKACTVFRIRLWQIDSRGWIIA